MKKITTIPYDEQNTRVETGALQINDDWKGLFIRGDWCIELLGVLEKIIDKDELTKWDILILKTYRDLIRDEVLIPNKKIK